MESISNIRFKFRRVLSSSALGCSILRVLKVRDEKYHRLFVTRSTEICIEGFPRCANSYAFNAFNRWNPGLKVGRHLHLSEQITRSLKYNKPVIVLVRDPGEAIASLSIGLPKVSLTELCKLYIQFHKVVFKNLKRVVVSEFETTINEFPKVVEKVNHKYNKSFNYGDINEGDKKEIFDHLKEHSEKIGWKKMTSAPDPNRSSNKSKIIKELGKNPYFPECLQLYNEIRKVAI